MISASGLSPRSMVAAGDLGVARTMLKPAPGNSTCRKAASCCWASAEPAPRAVRAARIERLVRMGASIRSAIDGGKYGDGSARTPCSDLVFPLKLAWFSSKYPRRNRCNGRPGAGGNPGIGYNVRLVFEDYALDSDRRELTRGAEPISIGPQVFDLLAYLL